MRKYGARTLLRAILIQAERDGLLSLGFLLPEIREYLERTKCVSKKTKEERREAYEKNRDAINARRRKWRAKNADSLNAARRKRYADDAILRNRDSERRKRNR